MYDADGQNKNKSIYNFFPQAPPSTTQSETAFKKVIKNSNEIS